MDLFDTLNITASGLTAQRVRLQTVASNMANARTTSTPEGGPYRRRAPVFSAERVDPFGDQLSRELARVEITDIETSDTEGMQVFDPAHPDADDAGFVTYPDIDVLHEMVDLMTTGRTYEANVNVLETTFQMAQRAIDIGR